MTGAAEAPDRVLPDRLSTVFRGLHATPSIALKPLRNRIRRFAFPWRSNGVSGDRSTWA